MNDFKSIKEWTPEDRPREKMIQKGPSALSNAELLAILINTGTAQRSALDIAKELLALGSDNLLELGKHTLLDIKKIKGLGEKKAVTVMAALELGKRRQLASAREIPIVKQSKDIFNHLIPYFMDKTSEEFYAVFISQSGAVLHIEQISKGGMTATVVDPRVLFRKALSISGVCRLIVAHNHPSGNLNPSEADKQLTQKLKEAGRLLQITLLDHIIVAENKFFSFADEGLL